MNDEEILYDLERDGPITDDIWNGIVKVINDRGCENTAPFNLKGVSA